MRGQTWHGQPGVPGCLVAVPSAEGTEAAVRTAQRPQGSPNPLRCLPAMAGASARSATKATCTPAPGLRRAPLSLPAPPSAQGLPAPAHPGGLRASCRLPRASPGCAISRQSSALRDRGIPTSPSPSTAQARWGAPQPPLLTASSLHDPPVVLSPGTCPKRRG